MKAMFISRMTTILLCTPTRFGIIYSAKPQQILKPSADGLGLCCCQVVKQMGGQTSKPAQQPAKHWQHSKACSSPYPRDNMQRFPVPDSKVPWEVPFPDYRPVDYTAGSVLAQPAWADVDVRTVKTPMPKWNQLDGTVDRRSHMGDYGIVDDCPRNPKGRTGMVGRGSLGRWGPNHAADPVVTRWKRDANGKIEMKNKLRVAQFVAIQRRDTKEWAIPGGMVDAGETVNATLKREFGEEALNSLEVSPENRQNIDALFKHGTEIYHGYVDDPRNTDNAWMETVAMNFHDEDGKSVGSIMLKAGDDAKAVEWMDMDKSLNLFASHTDFLQMTAAKLNASW